MRTIYPLIAILLFGCQSLSAQDDTLVGVLRDINEKVVKNYLVTLGKQKPQKVKTDRYGVFTIPKANLQDTLYVTIKKSKSEIAVPVNGYNFLNITLQKDTFKSDYRFEPDPYLVDILSRERNKMGRMNVMNKSDIEKSGCQDVRCLLQRLNGVQIHGDAVVVRGGANPSRSETNALIVIDGIQMQDASALFNLTVQSIQEISVMKDATMYGMQGANGAVVVKTW